MQKRTITVDLEIYSDLSELPLTVQKLIQKARKAREEAYAPYSLFRVGASLRLTDGTIVTGNNQENSAYPSGLCAERVAVFQAATRFPGAVISHLALTVRSEKKEIDLPTPPCGACRQVLAEYEHRQGSPIIIYFTGETGSVVRAPSVASILPMVFDRSFLI